MLPNGFGNKSNSPYKCLPPPMAVNNEDSPVANVPPSVL